MVHVADSSERMIYSNQRVSVGMMFILDKLRITCAALNASAATIVGYTACGGSSASTGGGGADCFGPGARSSGASDATPGAFKAPRSAEVKDAYVADLFSRWCALTDREDVYDSVLTS